ncbi:Uncharacterized protein MSYG_1849 [Malassezia sympodialis ATCC 42132]|uniref:Ribosomal protein/NADH dehydrogenase domain-containing protein n=1 Tax=Malassezia sympodialis (strain ATCC 42132) TaxID=1230383 RepID=A0A1M8A535_MALS4|nr:Uncharacterized protein MSYG_1849 [Malassezia sympodialis ATCC 42132]
MAARRTLAGVVARLTTGAGAHRLPANITGLTIRAPTKFSTKRDWTLLREELPRLVYANPALSVDVEPSEHASLQVHYANMPARTIVWGDKSATDIVHELLTMARFAGEAQS